MQIHFLWLYSDQWELVYYVAFVVLTAIIAFITLKTYVFQTKRTSKLFCKCTESEVRGHYSNVFLEIYNYGNDISKGINVKIQDRDFGVIPFLKPNESYLLCFAHFAYSLGGKVLQSNCTISDNLVKVDLDVSGKVRTFEIDISILTVSGVYPEAITTSIKDVSMSINQLKTAIEDVSRSVKQCGTIIAEK